MKTLFKVVSQDETIYTHLENKSEKTFVSKIVLQEIGEYPNIFVATLLGKNAQCRFYNGELVVAVLKFSVNETNGQSYQEVLVDEIIKLKY